MIFEDAVAYNVLLHYLQSEPFDEGGDLGLIHIVGPSTSKLNFASNSLARFEDKTGDACLLEVMSGL
ncbi:hypothetical protein Trco_004686 [Trichoderma cornu-damae]|uniref:Uncharacterized protein n=1 Tax=Trichoderma cornu-damae TaxID=654480 RepID=A0A9P8QMT2_9HYPO|nr:hypothetical protein Trco_004686 [Trichoderma cornu-damae]